MTDELKSRVGAESEQDTEQRILEAARRVFVKRGTAGARMQEIAAEAGVNQALLHYYFRSKDRLAATVFEEAAGRLLPAIVQLLSSDASLEEKIERFVHLYIDAVRQNPFLPGYIIAELHQQPERLTSLIDPSGPIPLAARAVLERLDAQLREAAAAGKMRPMSPEQLFLNMIGLSVMPFLARPLFRVMIGMDDEAFGRFLDERRAELPGFILRGLRP